LYSGVACITDLMVKEGLINLDFADVRSVMREMGRAMMGTGEASGEGRAMAAAEAAIANPLLDETTMKGAQGLLISITGGRDMTLFEVDEAATRIREEVDADANIILGATFDEALEGLDSGVRRCHRHRPDRRRNRAASGHAGVASGRPAAATLPQPQASRPVHRLSLRRHPRPGKGSGRRDHRFGGSRTGARTRDRQPDRNGRQSAARHQRLPSTPDFQPQSRLFAGGSEASAQAGSTTAGRWRRSRRHRQAVRR
jgi:cell division protein FtsZ